VKGNSRGTLFRLWVHAYEYRYLELGAKCAGPLAPWSLSLLSRSAAPQFSTAVRKLFDYDRQTHTHACAPHRTSRVSARAATHCMRSSASWVAWSVWVGWWLVISAISVMYRYASLYRVRWEEVESAHLKSSVAVQSCSTPSPASVHGSYASPCDETSTSSGRQAAWAGTGRTGVIGRRSTLSDSSKIVSNEDLVHEQCSRDGYMRRG
jgi:hypothetical protein